MADDLPDAPWAGGGDTAALDDAPWVKPSPGLLESAAKPITDLPSTYQRMVNESVEQIKRGAGQLASGQPWEMAKGAGNVALGGMGYVTAPINAPLHTFVGEPTEAAAGKIPMVGPAIAPLVGETAEGLAGFALPTKFPRLRSAPALPAAEPYGITRTLGERTGDLGVRAEEAGAMRAGEPYAKEFGAQRAAQIDAAQEGLTRGLDPYAQSVIAETPAEAGGFASQAIQTEAGRAKAGVRSLYDTAKASPGEIHAGAFEGMPQGIKGDLTLGDNPVIIDNTTPQASKMIDYLDQQIGALKLKNKADPFGQPNPENIVGVNLQGVDQWRKNLSMMRRDAFASSMPGQTSADARASQAVLDNFDKRIDQTVNSNLFTGDKSAVDAWNQARQAYSDYRKTFTAGRNDPVGRVMQKIIGDPINDPLTPTKVLDQIVGTTGVTATPTNIGVANRVKSVLGESSPEWIGVKQGLVQRLIMPGEGEAALGTAQQAQRLSKFLNSDMAGVIYSPAEQGVLRGYANLMRDITMPPGTYAPSEPAIRRMQQAVTQRIGGIIGAVIGRTLSPFPIMGELAGYTAGKQIESAAEKHFNNMSKNFPIVSNAMRQWSQAQVRAAAAPNPLARRAAVGATVNLQRAVNPFGIDLKQLPVAPAGAEDQQQQVPGPADQRQNGGRVQQHRAVGGKVASDSGHGTQVESAFHPSAIPGARKARNGRYYMNDPQRPGKFLMIRMKKNLSHSRPN